MNTRQMKWFRDWIEDDPNATVEDYFSLIIYSKDNLVVEYFTFPGIKGDFKNRKEKYEKGNTLFGLNKILQSDSTYWMFLNHVPR